MALGIVSKAVVQLYTEALLMVNAADIWIDADVPDLRRVRVFTDKALLRFISNVTGVSIPLIVLTVVVTGVVTSLEADTF